MAALIYPVAADALWRKGLIHFAQGTLALAVQLCEPWMTREECLYPALWLNSVHGL